MASTWFLILDNGGNLPQKWFYTFCRFCTFSRGTLDTRETTVAVGPYAHEQNCLKSGGGVRGDLWSGDSSLRITALPKPKRPLALKVLGSASFNPLKTTSRENSRNSKQPKKTEMGNHPQKKPAGKRESGQFRSFQHTSQLFHLFPVFRDPSSPTPPSIPLKNGKGEF